MKLQIAGRKALGVASIINFFQSGGAAFLIFIGIEPGAQHQGIQRFRRIIDIGYGLGDGQGIFLIVQPQRHLIIRQPLGRRLQRRAFRGQGGRPGQKQDQAERRQAKKGKQNRAAKKGAMNPAYRKGREIKVHIADIGMRGEGIGKLKDGYTVFIKDAVIGDYVRASIMKANKSYAYAHLEQILQASPHRVEPLCPIAKQCGGCQLQALSYERELEYKQNKVRADLIRLGGFDEEEIDAAIKASENNEAVLRGTISMGTLQDTINDFAKAIQPYLDGGEMQMVDGTAFKLTPESFAAADSAVEPAA